MSRFENITKPLTWFMALLLAAVVAGCGGGGDGSPASSVKTITAYSLAGVTGTINETAKTITVTVPHNTSVTARAATFTTTGAGVKVGTMVQTSATTVNDFTNPVPYTVTAADSTTTIYTVTVTVSLIDAKAITAFSFNGFPGSPGVITEPAHTIAVTLPFGTTPLTGLVAAFTSTGAASVPVKIGVTNQTSGTTANDFANSVTTPVAYIVTAADGSTATYNVTVTVAAATAKAITAYSLAGVSGTIDEMAKTIAVAMPSGTPKTSLVATFTATGASVKIGAVAQASGTTVNNFTSPVAYIVTAADGSMETYTVTVAVAAGPAKVLLGSAGNFVILAKTGVSTTGATAVTGNIGVSPVAATGITGFGLIADSTNVFSTSSLVTGKLYAADYAEPTPTNMTTTISNMETAFKDAAGRSLPDHTELGAGNISGMTLAPGLYKWGTGVLITDVGVTLAGGADEVWIFQIAQDLNVANGAIVTLSGGAQAENIFWQVGGLTGATLGTTADFKGIILTAKLISLNTGARLSGRALAQSAVTLNANTVTAP